MENDYYSSLTEEEIKQNDVSSEGYYEVKERPTRTEFYRQPEQKNAKIGMLLLGAIVIVFSIVDYYLLWSTYDSMSDVPDSIYTIIQTLIIIAAVLQVPIQIWANEISTIAGIICELVALYLSLTNLSFTPIGLVAMVALALQFNKAQAITGKYKRKYSDG